jgi:hypothetical protein
MKKFREISEAIKDKYDIGEYDQEGDMAKSDLRSIIANSKRVHDMLKDDDNLPEWVQSKITKAEDYMSTVANYLESEMNEAVKMPKQTRAEKEYRKITGKTVDQRMSELDKVQKDLAKQREDYIKQGIIKAESVELDEALRHEIAGQVGRFIGNKIDPVHGDIMHAHGKEAYRQAAYHIRKTVNDVKDAVSSLHDRLHKQLRTGGLATEDVEELDETNENDAKRREYYAKLGGGPGSKKSGGKAVQRGHQKSNASQEKPTPPNSTVERKSAIVQKLIASHRQARDKHDNKSGELNRIPQARKTKEQEKQQHQHAMVSDYHNDAVKDLNHHEKTGSEDSLKSYKKQVRKIGLYTRKNPQLTKENVETLDEARYPGFRPGLGLGKRGAPSQRDNYKDFNDGRPFGFTPIKDKKPEEPKKMKEEAELLDEKNEPTNPELWSRAKSLAKSKFDVYPSAYANGWASKWYKSKGGGWKSVSEEVEELDENMMKKLAAAGIAASLAASPAAQARVTPGGQSVAQQAVATQKAPEQKKASVPSKSYLQTVASGKSRSIMHPDTAKELLKKHYSEETDLDEGYFKNQEIERQETERLAKRNELPFTPDKPKKRSVVVGKKPEGYSRVRQLARQAIPKPVKEAKEMSKKAKIVKDAMKKSPDDKFQANPELSNSVTRNL